MFLTSPKLRKKKSGVKTNLWLFSTPELLITYPFIRFL